MGWILGLILLSTIFTGLSSPTIISSLKIVQYQPMVFELSFSQKVSKPQFQLLFNHFQNIPYFFIGESNDALSYYIQVSSAPTSATKFQMYQLVFNSPMSIGQGRLDLGSFNLKAAKPAIRTEIPSGYATFVMIMGYLLSNFTLLGNIILEYSQFYVLLMFKSQLSTTLYKDFSIELLLIPNADIITSYPHYKDFIFECLAIPLLLIYVFGAIGYLMKRCVKVKNSIKINIVYDMFTYQAFLNIFIIFSPNLLFNSAQFVSFVTSNSVPLDSTEKTIGSILVYFSLLTLITITYMHIYVLNPKLKETQQSWEKYLQTNQFRAFFKLHQGINTSSWQTRNSSIVVLLKKILIIGVFYSGIFEYLLVYIQFASLYYFFTIRPYKQELYMNIYFSARLMTFIIYGIIVLGDIYFSLGVSTFNYSSAKQFLIVRDAAFLCSILVILGVVVRQVYQKITNLNYRFRVIRQQNEFKLQILEKNDNSGAFQLKKQDVVQVANKERRSSSNHRSARHESESKSKKSHPNNDNQHHTLSINTSHSLKKRKSQVNLQEIDGNLFRSLAISPDKSSSLKGKQAQNNKQAKIWKDESILQEMIKMK